MIRNTFQLSTCTAIVLSLASFATAEVFFSDSFDYGSVGDPLAGFRGWDESQPDAPITILQPGLLYPGYGGSGNAVAIADCCNGDAIHRGPGAILDSLFGTDGTFFVTFLTQQRIGPTRGGIWLMPGAIGPGWVTLSGQSPGYYIQAVLNDNSEVQGPLFLDGNEHPLGFGTTELMAMRFTIDTFGTDFLDVLRSPDLTWDEGTDWADPTKEKQGDFSGNTDYFIRLASSHNGGGPRIDEIRICDTWTECLSGGVGPPPAPATNFTWVANAVGDWAEQSNWHYTGLPPVAGVRANAADHAVVFGDAILKPTTVVTDADITVNRIEFNNATNGYVVGGLGSVNLAANTSNPPLNPSMSVLGTHQFQVNVNLHDDTTVNVSSESTVIFNNALALNGNTLTKIGAGTMAINNILASAGTINCDEGTCSGSGTIGGDLNNNGGTISPGSSPGVMAVEEDFTQSQNGKLLIELGGTAAGTDHDVLQVGGAAVLVDGSISVVPEPTGIVLVAFGFIGLICHGRRRRVDSSVSNRNEHPAQRRTMTRRGFSLTICTAIVLGSISSAGAALIFSDSFDYGSADEPLAGFGGWEETQPNTPITILEPGLSYPGYASSGNAVKITDCCNGEAIHRGPSAALDGVFGTDGKFFVTFLTQQDAETNRGGIQLIAGAHEGAAHPSATGSGRVSMFGVSPGYAVQAVNNDLTEFFAYPLLNRSPFAVGLGTTELLAMRFTIDTMGREILKVLRSPELTGDEDTDWKRPRSTRLGDFSGNIDYFIEMISTAHGGGPIIDELRICDTWTECLTGVGGPPHPPTTRFIWATDGISEWAQPRNWHYDGTPPAGGVRANGADHTAVFADAISVPTTVVTNAAITVNRIEFNNAANSYAVGGHGSVNLAAKTSNPPMNPSISVLGTHQFQVNVNLYDDTTVNVSSESTVIFNNDLTLNANTLTKIGPGTMAINNVLTSGGGAIDCDQGTCSGSGVIGGDLNNLGGTISPGDSAVGAAQIPEPGAMLLLLIGMVAYSCLARISYTLRREWG